MYLFVESQGRKPPSIPVFREGETVSGRVELHCEKPETDSSEHRGNGQEEIRFLEIKELST